MSTPYFALYPTDFLADVGHLGNTELGIYWRLLLVYYRDGRPLPFDTDRLRRLAMAFSPEEYRALDSVVSEFFLLSTEPDGTRAWRNKRADKELANAKEKHAAAVKKASSAAEARWSKDRAPSNAPSNAPSIAQALLKQCQPEPEPEPLLKTPSTSSRVSGLPAEPVDQGANSDGKEAANDSPTEKRKRLPSCPYEAVMDAYNRILPNLPEAQTLTKTRQRGIKSLWDWVLTSKRRNGEHRATSAAEAMAWLEGYFERAKLNDFLMGRLERAAGHANWRCDIDFLMSERGLKQVVEKTAVAA